MAVIQTTVNELKAREYSARSVRLNRVYAEINFAKRKLISLQQELGILKSSELLVLQQMNRFTKLEQVEHFYASDRYQTNDPVQSLKPVETTYPDPDGRINWTQNQLAKGMQPMQAERERISAEVKRVSQAILQYQHTLEVNEKLLLSMGGKTQEQLVRDNIAKRQYSELYMLFEVAKQYRYLSMMNENRRYSSDPSLVKKFNRLQELFQAYAERNADVLNRELKLDMIDPGSDQNMAALANMLDRRRRVLSDESLVTYDKELTAYSQQLSSQLSDVNITQNVSRQPDAKRVPEANNALNVQTKLTANFVLNLNKKQNQIFGLDADSTSSQYPRFYLYYDETFTDFAPAVKDWFQRNVSKRNGGKPFCDPVPQSADDKGKASAEQQQKEAETTASQQITTQFSKTKTVVDMTTINAAVENLYKDVNSAIDIRGAGDADTFADLLVLTIKTSKDTTKYYAYDFYLVRVANSAQKVIDYVDGQWLLGNVTTDQRDSYMNKLKSILTFTQVAFRTEVS